MDKPTKKALTEIKAYENYLNSVVGAGSLGFAIACLGTPHPSLSALIVLITLAPFRKSAENLAPRTVMFLREQHKKYPNDVNIRKSLERVEKSLFNFKRLVRFNWTYFVGVFFFMIVLFSEWVPPNPIVKYLLNK